MARTEGCLRTAERRSATPRRSLEAGVRIGLLGLDAARISLRIERRLVVMQVTEDGRGCSGMEGARVEMESGGEILAQRTTLRSARVMEGAAVVLRTGTEMGLMGRGKADKAG